MGNQAELLKNKMSIDQAKEQFFPDTPTTGKTLEGWMESMAGPLKEALPAAFPVERFTRMIITNYKATPALQQCTMQSVLGAALQAAQIGLMIGVLDQAYLVPYNNRKKHPQTGEWYSEREAQLQIGYKGYLQLGHRTGKISHVDRGKVYPGDVFDYEYGSNAFIKHKEGGLEQDNTLPTHYYCIVHLNNGRVKFLVRTYAQIIRHAKKHTDMFDQYGKPNSKSNWVKNFDSMAMKTVIRELFQTMELSTDVLLALSADGTIKNADERTISRNMAEEVFDITNHNAPEAPEAPAAAATPQKQPADPNADDAPYYGDLPSDPPPPYSQQQGSSAAGF